jgi:hypothetical protein
MYSDAAINAIAAVARPMYLPIFFSCSIENRLHYSGFYSYR